MTPYPYTLRQLEVFETLCELGSFRRASDALGISQAAVSNQLKALERQIGVTLLARDPGKRPRLTPEGASFLADLGQFWRAAHTLARHREADPQDEGQILRLRVLIGNYLLRDNVRPQLDRFLDAHPGIQLDFVSPTISETPRHLLDRDGFDLALYQDPIDDAPVMPGTHTLARIRCGVFGNRSLLNDGREMLSAEEASELPFILPPAGTPYENVILAMLAREGIKPRSIVSRTQYFDVMASMLDRGSSAGVLIQPLVRPEHHNLALLHRLADWRLQFYRNPKLTDPRIDEVERFLVGAALDDANYIVPAR